MTWYTKKLFVKVKYNVHKWAKMIFDSLLDNMTGYENTGIWLMTPMKRWRCKSRWSVWSLICPYVNLIWSYAWPVKHVKSMSGGISVYFRLKTEQSGKSWTFEACLKSCALLESYTTSWSWNRTIDMDAIILHGF